MIINKKRENLGRNLGIKSTIVIFIVAIIIINVLYIDVFNSTGQLYIKLFNMGMPFTKNYVEEKPENKSIMANPLKVVGMEVSFFNMDSDNMEYDEHSLMAFEPFVLNDESIYKFTPEESPKEGAVASKAFNPNLKKTLDVSKPEVLIYHTHSSEQYLPKTKDCNDEAYSVIGVGNELEKELEAYGISVVHDKTMHSLKSYDASYSRSGETVDKYINQYGQNFKFIIDVHRDATPNNSSVLTTLNGEKVARISLVNTKNSKYYEQNAVIVNSIREISNELFPGFFKGLTTYNRGRNAFNQNKSPNSILIEVGSQQNTMDESKASAKYIARILAEQLNKK